jgi:hypothetical protein
MNTGHFGTVAQAERTAQGRQAKMMTAASLIEERRNRFRPMMQLTELLLELAQVQPTSTGPAPHPCPVRFCTGLAPLGAICCPDCWSRTPAAFRRAYHFAEPRAMHNRAAREFVAEIVEHALRRLSAERTGESDLPGGGPLAADDRQVADELTRRCGAADSFQDLIDAQGGRWPKLDCSPRWQPDRAACEAATKLADLYDREQAARRDPRRAMRLGIAGL